MPRPSQAPTGFTPMSRPPDMTHNAAIVNRTFNDPSIMSNIHNYNLTEVNRGGYWMHQGDGFQYWHYCDPNGMHWYGWYTDNVMFWTIWQDENWWWYDSYWARWDIWQDGYWWYYGDDGTPYIVVDGNYYRYTDVPGGAGLIPDSTPPVVQPPSDPGNQPDPSQKLFYSQDGTRMIQVVDDNNDAYLYDTASPPSFDPVWLTANATDVRFKYSSDGTTLDQILVLTSDGSFSLFDANGNPSNQNGQVQAGAGSTSSTTAQPQQLMLGERLHATLDTLRGIFDVR